MDLFYKFIYQTYKIIDEIGEHPQREVMEIWIKIIKFFDKYGVVGSLSLAFY
jgi:hypothetical protein